MARYSAIFAVTIIFCILAGPVSSFTASDYKDAISKAILFFEGQRSGKLPVSQRVKWRGDSALIDGKIENVWVIYIYSVITKVLIFFLSDEKYSICLKKNNIRFYY